MERQNITDQHRWLQRLLGDWVVEDPTGDGPPWLETVSPIGKTWIQATGSGEMPGGEPAHTVMMLGFDPALGRFVGSFVGSMMTNLWVYEGELDASGTVLTLRTEGPDMREEGKSTSYRDVITADGGHSRELRSEMLTAEGKWQEVMRMTYKRR